MPFKSEKQRRYLWANEPEIARDWTDTYGSRIQKSKGGITQAGAINYEPSDMVSVPKEFRARAHSPNTHLAYITDDEAGILQALKPDTPHKGPRGIPNYDSFDAQLGYTSGRDIDDSTGQARGGGSTFSGDPVGTVTGAPPPDPANEVVPGDVTYTGNNPWADSWNEQDIETAPKGVWKKTKKDEQEQWEKDNLTKTKKVKTKGGGWQSLWSPEVHYNLALNLPGAKKSRLAHMKAYKDYLDAQGLDSSWLDPQDLSYAQWQEMKGFKPELAKMPPSQMTNVDYFPQDYKHFMLTQRRNPNIFVSGDLGNFWNKPNPKGAINPDTGLPFTNTEWDAFKKGIIQDRGLSTGNDNQDDPYAFINRGYPGEGDQGGGDGGDGGGGGGGGGGGTPADTVFPYKDYGTVGYEDIIAKQFGPTSWARGGRVPAAFGGIMDTRTGRRAYGLGSVFKSITKPFKSVAKAAKKVLKSDWGKLALLYGAGAMAGSYGNTGRLFSSGMFSPSNMGRGLFGISAKGQALRGFPELAGQKGLLSKWGLTQGYGSFLPTWAGGITALSMLPFTPLGKAPKQQSLGMGDRGGGLTDPITGEKDAKPAELRASLDQALSAAWNEDKQAYESEAMAAIKQAFPYLGKYPIYKVEVKDGGRIGYRNGNDVDPDDPLHEVEPLIIPDDADISPDDFWAKRNKPSGIMMASAPDPMDEAFQMYKDAIKKGLFNGTFDDFLEKIDEMRDYDKTSAVPRMMAQEGGLMNLGGMEKDYRNNGGFVAIGGEERADDVPARLSRNEFVFTADAVRGAGGGDIDKGAEIMENVMKNLEQGGKISEETQGNTGAQEMFSVSERIGEVL